jgi:hypothetical protein
MMTNGCRLSAVGYQQIIHVNILPDGRKRIAILSSSTGLRLGCNTTLPLRGTRLVGVTTVISNTCGKSRIGRL